MSNFFERYYVSRGVRLLKEEKVVQLEGKERVSAVVLSSGNQVACDMVIAGVGAAPVTEVFAKTGLEIESQGQHWASVIRGDRQAFVHVPYFFSDVFDLSYELWGDPHDVTETVVRGDANSPSFSVWWLNGDRLVAALP
jgi:hypothetical protein